ncbi:MAG: hypothetical protein Kow0029_30550 [Candidatus Rifleibacteriota bacterium]
MKNRHFSYVIVFTLIAFCSFCPLWSLQIPVDSPPEEVLAIKLYPYDLNNDFDFGNDSSIRDPFSAAGWIITYENYSGANPYEVYESAFPGFLTQLSHKPSNNGIEIKYGYFNSTSDADAGAKSQIGLWYGGGTVDIPTNTLNFPSSFSSGKTFGEKSWVWDMSLCSLKTLPGHDNAMISFRRNRFAISMTARSARNVSLANKQVLELLAEKIDQKIKSFQGLKDLKLTKDSLHASGQISNDGVAKSLNKKIDRSLYNFETGNYKTAMNQLNSFVNELEAQRGKHVSESAYQTLKGYADSIVQSLTALMN